LRKPPLFFTNPLASSFETDPEGEGGSDTRVPLPKSGSFSKDGVLLRGPVEGFWMIGLLRTAPLPSFFGMGRFAPGRLGRAGRFVVVRPNVPLKLPEFFMALLDAPQVDENSNLFKNLF